MKNLFRKFFRLIARFPMISFLIVLALLFLLIFIGNKMRAPEVTSDEDTVAAKTVQTMSTTATHYIETSGEILDDNVITITATTPGIVHWIHTITGATVTAGAPLVTLAETYGGGNTASTTKSITDRSVQHQNDTFDKNIGITDDLRDDVGGDSLDAEIARKQQTLQKRNLEFQRDITTLEQQQASQNAARFFPTAPITGTIERIFIQPGDTVGGGAPLMIVRGTEEAKKIVVTLSAEMARAIDVQKPSQIIRTDGSVLEIYAQHISAAPTDARAFSVTFFLDDSEINEYLTDGDYIHMMIPMEGGDDTFLVPLDAVQLMNDDAIIFVADNGFAQAHSVTLGSVLGDYVMVLSGIDQNDVVITDRTVFDGDAIIVGSS